MASLASVKINTGRNSRDSGLDEVNANLRELIRIVGKGDKLDRSGLGGGMGGIGNKGFIAAIVAAIVASKDVLLGAGGALGEKVDEAYMTVNNNTAFSYDKIVGGEGGFMGLGEGEKGVAKIDEKTGEIVEVMTEQEAIQRGILDSTKKFNVQYKNINTTLDNMSGQLTDVAGYYEVSNETVGLIVSEELKQLEYNKRISAAKKALAERLEAQAGTKGSDDPITDFANQIGSSSFLDLARRRGVISGGEQINVEAAKRGALSQVPLTDLNLYFTGKLGG